MRRSAAPSQSSQGVKRPRFAAPMKVVSSFSSSVSSQEVRANSKVQISSTGTNFCGQGNNRVISNPSLFKCVIKSSDNENSSVSKTSLSPAAAVCTTSCTISDFNKNTGIDINISESVLPKRDLSAIISLTSKPPPQFSVDTDNQESVDYPLDADLPCDFKDSNSTCLQEQRAPLEEIEANKKSLLSGSSLPVSVGSVKQNTKTETPSEETDTRYFSVVWCKLSKKKHKKWEGDAVLTTKARSATLYDMEGKIIGKGTGYKIIQLQTLGEDETLVVGGKEIQVMGILKEDHFRSGQCFSAAGACNQSTNQTPSLGECPKKSGQFKPFVNPIKNGGGKLPFQPRVESSMSEGSPRHNPSTPNALVMPRPRPDLQWRHNKSGLPIVDVVVDPFISHFLREHQRQGVVFLYECVMEMRDYEGQGAILADDMGLGKTLQCIALIWTLLKQGPYGGKPMAKKVIIVTPGSLVTNWYMEFKKWLGLERLNVFAVTGDRKVDEFVKSTIHPVLIISYEMLVRCFDTMKNVPFDLVVCDEGHRLKNTAIKTTSLIASLPTRKRVVLTGTPVQNDLQEFYSIVEFCNPSILGSSSAFKRVYEDPIILSRQPKSTPAQKALGMDRAEELTRLTQMFVLRRTQEINNKYLPPKMELVLFCRPSPLQLSLYRQLVSSQIIRRCLMGNLSGAPHLICIGALKEVCNHPSLVYNKVINLEMKQKNGKDCEDSIYTDLLQIFPPTFDPGRFDVNDSGKLQVLCKILDSIWQASSHEKVVLVANHTKTLDILQGFCEGQGYQCLRLDGQTPTSQRQNLVNKFNSQYNTMHRIFLLSSKAGGVGLNLVGASRLILYDIDWNPANDLQAMARVWRDGQRGKVHIYRLLTTGTIEEKIYQRQISKQGLSGTIMDTNNKNNVQFSVDDLKDLFSVNERTDCETHSLLACECDGDPNYIPLTNSRISPPKDNRPCQLGQSSLVKKSKSKEKNLTMAELLQWNHWRGCHASNNNTWYLEEVGSALSFLFWHETNTQNRALVHH